MYNEKTLDPSWKKLLSKEFEKDYMKELKKYLLLEKGRSTVFPKSNQIFNAFNYTTFNNIKVVILGQDPYHNKGQAHGLSFSVPDGVRTPPSLKNIFNEIHQDLNINNHTKGNLKKWAIQGVLLLNTNLTVRKNEPGSHQRKGWETFTDKVISLISNNKTGIIFMLWGRAAKKKSKLIDSSKHYILYSPHPSPLSAYKGFFGCNHFSSCNKILKSQNKTVINWKT